MLPVQVISPIWERKLREFRDRFGFSPAACAMTKRQGRRQYEEARYRAFHAISPLVRE